MRSLILLLLLGWSYLCHAQWYKCMPVKVEHKWGLVDVQGEEVLAPQFDALGTEHFRAIQHSSSYASRYIKASVGDKLGLVSWRGEEVLAAEYEDVIPLTDSVFCVKQEGGYRVVDRRGALLITDYFDKIRVVHSMRKAKRPAYFKVTKDSLSGIWQQGVGLLFEMQKFEFLDVLQKGETVLITAQKREFDDRKLLDKNGKTILQIENTYYKLIAPNLIIAENESKSWEAYDTLGTLVIPKGYSSYRKLSDRFYAFSKNNNHFNQIFNTETLQFLDLPFESFYPISETYFCGVSEGRKALLGPQGEIILPAQFKEILPFEGDEKLIVLKDKWGIYDVPSNEYALAMDYDKIVRVAKVIDGEYITEALENASEDAEEIYEQQSEYVLYQIEQKGLKGLINQDLDFVFEPKYDKLFLEFPFIKGFQGYAMDLLEVDEEAKVIDTETYAKVYTVKVGHGFAEGLDAVGMSVGQMQNLAGPRTGSPSRAQLEYDAWEKGLEFFKTSPYGYAYDEDGRKIMTEIATNRVLINGERITAIEHLPFTKLSLLYQTHHATTGAFNEMNHKPIIAHPWVAALFDHTTGELVSDFEIVGVRALDFVKGHEHAAVLLANSQFALMDKQGGFVQNEQKKRMEATFIGLFQKNLARICFGGLMSKTTEPQDKKYRINQFVSLSKQFRIMPSGAANNSRTFGPKIDKDKGVWPQWGYINTKGQLAIDTLYSYCENFKHDGLAICQKEASRGLIDTLNNVKIPFEYVRLEVYQGTRWKLYKLNRQPTFYNTKGHEIIDNTYQKSGSFADEKCKVKRDGFWGYVNKDGYEVIACQYLLATDFENGRANVFTKGEEWVQINEEGVKQLNYSELLGSIQSLRAFHSGLALIKKRNRYGYINENGEVVIATQFSKAFDFKNGVARAVKGAKTGLLDTEGKWVMKPKTYEMILPFDDNGLAKAKARFKGKFLLLNSKGQPITPMVYDEITDFENGHAKVRMGRTWGLINTTGQLVLPCVHAALGDLSEGLIAARPIRQYQWVYKNLNNEVVVKGKYDAARPFLNGYAQVIENSMDQKGYQLINLQGETAAQRSNERITKLFVQDGINGYFCNDDFMLNGTNIKNQYYYGDDEERNIYNQVYQQIEPFKNGMASVKIRNRWGQINQFGLPVIPAKYGAIRPLKGDLLFASPTVLVGLADRDGTMILDPMYDQLQVQKGLNRMTYQVTAGERVGYLNRDFEWIWALQK